MQCKTRRGAPPPSSSSSLLMGLTWADSEAHWSHGRTPCSLPHWKELSVDQKKKQEGKKQMGSHAPGGEKGGDQIESETAPTYSFSLASKTTASNPISSSLLFFSPLVQVPETSLHDNSAPWVIRNRQRWLRLPPAGRRQIDEQVGDRLSPSNNPSK